MTLQEPATTNSTNTVDNNVIDVNNIEILYIVGSSGSGKTFSGDYYSLFHDFTHIDGDGPVKNQHRSQHYKEISTNFYKVVQQYWPKNQDGPDGLWRPYMDELVKQTLDAIKHNATNNKKKNRIVLTHAMYRQTIREYVINKLQHQGGIQKKNITVVQLRTDPDVEREALYYRNKKLARSGQPTLEDQMRSIGWKIKGMMDEKTFKKVYQTYLEIPFEDHKRRSNKDAVAEKEKVIIVDVSKRDITHLNQLNEAIGHTSNKNKSDTPSYVDICDQIKRINAQREKEYNIVREHTTSQIKIEDNHPTLTRNTTSAVAA